MFCSNCGKEVQSEEKICSQCGTSIKNRTAKKKKNLKILPILLGYIGISVIGSLIVGIDDSETKAPSNSEINTYSDKMNEFSNEQSNTIISAIAQNENDLTGTYEDIALSLKLIIIQKDGLVTYNFCGSDGSEPFIETDCRIESTYIAGQYYYITKNMDGSLAISSGAGGEWGKFVKIDDEAIINLEEMNLGMSGKLTYCLDEDVENGLLYSNDDGKITDEEGNLIPEYDYLFASPAGGLIDTINNTVLSGYMTTDEGMVCLKGSLLPQAWESNCATGVISEGSGSYIYTYMEDDGNYFDEVILKAWYDESGSPKANAFPQKLDTVFVNNGLIIAEIEDLHFIDGDWYTYESVLRDPFADDNSAPFIYAVMIEDISKWDDNCFVGTEYTSKKPVVVYGRFSGILNGDDVLMFGTLLSLTSNDEPEFKGMYLEIVNGRY